MADMSFVERSCGDNTEVKLLPVSDKKMAADAFCEEMNLFSQQKLQTWIFHSEFYASGRSKMKHVMKSDNSSFIKLNST